MDLKSCTSIIERAFCANSWFSHLQQLLMLSFVSSSYQTGKSWGMCPHDSDRCCPCIPNCPGLPPCSPWMPGGFVWLFMDVHPLLARVHIIFKKEDGLDPQDSCTRMDPRAGLGAAMESWYTQSSAGWEQPWDGSNRQEMFSLWTSPRKTP